MTNNPWLKILFVLIGVPLALLLFTLLCIYGSGRNSEFFTLFFPLAVIAFVAYKAIAYHRKQKKLQSSKG